MKTTSFGKSTVGSLQVERFQISSREGRCSTEVSDIKGLSSTAQKALNERFQKERKAAMEECRIETGATRYSSIETVDVVGSFLRISDTGEYFGDGAAHTNSWVDAAHIFELKSGTEIRFDESLLSAGSSAMATCSIRALFKGGAYEADVSIGKALALDVERSSDDKTYFVLRQASTCTTCTETAAKLPLSRTAAQRILKPEVFTLLNAEKMPPAFFETGSSALDEALKNCFEPPAPKPTPSPAPTPTAQPSPV